MPASDITSEGKKILQALSQADAPLANKQIAAASGLDSKVISNTIKKFKTQGLVDSPARCKYGLTSQGEEALK